MYFKFLYQFTVVIQMAYKLKYIRFKNTLEINVL